MVVVVVVFAFYWSPPDWVVYDELDAEVLSPPCSPDDPDVVVVVVVVVVVLDEPAYPPSVVAVWLELSPPSALVLALAFPEPYWLVYAVALVYVVPLVYVAPVAPVVSLVYPPYWEVDVVVVVVYPWLDDATLTVGLVLITDQASSIFNSFLALILVFHWDLV